MGHRECRRVPKDFDWPLHKVWDGYLTPPEFQFLKCWSCDGSGYGPEARAIADTFYPHMIGGPHAYRLAWMDKLGQAEVDNLIAEGRRVPATAEEVNALNRPGAKGFGHDAINRWVLVRFRCKALGITELCTVCSGCGDIATDEQRAAADAWEPSQPPVGSGWQLWETTSEGSPVSPVFDSAEELAAWCADGATWFANQKSSSEVWLRSFLNDTTDLDSLMVLVAPAEGKTGG